VELRGRAIHVWRLALDDEDCSAVEACAGVLSPEERVRADRFRSLAAKYRFVRCRAVLRALVHAYAGGDSPATVVFEQGRFGKPVLAAPGRAPLHFNVSHTSGMAVIALASWGPVGVDVERIHDMPDRERLASRCFGASEQAQLAALPAPARIVGFFQGWTRKEAFLKATGEGLSRSLHDIAVSLGHGEPARFLRVPGPPGAERAWSLHAFEPAAGYTAAVAAPWSGSTLTLLDFHAERITLYELPGPARASF
jgi:4'-phosphopantetheinyl transferase